MLVAVNFERMLAEMGHRDNFPLNHFQHGYRRIKPMLEEFIWDSLQCVTLFALLKTSDAPRTKQLPANTMPGRPSWATHRGHLPVRAVKK